MMTVKITGLNELVTAFRKSPEIVKGETKTAIAKTILTLLRYARINFSYFPDPKNPNTPRTGFLMGSGMQQTFGELTGKLENVAPYGIYVHDGTSKMQPPRPFFELAISEGQSEIDGFFDEALQNVVRKLAA